MKMNISFTTFLNFCLIQFCLRSGSAVTKDGNCTSGIEYDFMYRMFQKITELEIEVEVVKSRLDSSKWLTEAQCINLSELWNLGENVAHKKPVVLSSDYNSVSLGSLMVDGIRSSSWPCAGTQPTANPYAVIDLLKTYTIRYVYLLNRWDCCPERLHDLLIWVGNDVSNMALAAYYQPAVGRDCTIALPFNTRARYVKLQLITSSEYLTLCEVEIYT